MCIELEMNHRQEREAEMDKEKRLIASLEARLAVLDRKASRRSLERRELDGNRVLNTDSGNDPFDLVFQEEAESTSKLLESVAKLERQQEAQSEWQNMQPLLREFCFTQVDRQENCQPNIVAYQFVGYFTVNPSTQATFLVDFSIPNQQKARIVNLTCSLSSSDGSSLEWLEHRTKPKDPLHLAGWITAIHQYLAFSRQRQTFLQDQSISIQQTRQDRYWLSIDETNLVLTWAWKFSQGRDVLRLTSQGDLSQLELDSLVQVCENSCFTALTVLQRHLEEGGHETPSDNDSSASERLALSPSGRRRSAYEVRRLRKMERNHEKLQSLGLVKQQEKKKSKKSKKKRVLLDYRGSLVDDPAVRKRKSRR